MSVSGLKISISCLFTSMVLAGTAQNNNLKYVQAKDPSFVADGRFLRNPNGSLVYSLPGVTVYTAFEGTSLSLVVKDFGPDVNYLTVLVDDAAPKLVRLNQKDTLYAITTSLSTGWHALKIVKRTESFVGKVEFRGIYVQPDARTGNYPNLPQTRLLAIGNSITAGYGNDTSIAANPNTGFTSRREDNYNTYGHIAARALNARYAAFAYSGRGLARNNDNKTTGVIPDIFDRIFPDDPASTWDHAAYVPDWITVNLGTNDFSAEVNGGVRVDSAAFVTKYLSFVARLKQLYPAAHIVLMVGPMMTDDYPANARHWSRIQAYVKAVVTREQRQNNNQISYLKFEPQQGPYGEDWHPTIQTHQQMAAQLTTFLKATVTGLEEEELHEDRLIVFPNPAREFLVVRNSAMESPIQVYNAKGELVLTRRAVTSEVRIDLHQFAKGMYVLKNNNKSVTFVVE